MNCPSWGFENPEGHRLCGGCAAALSAELDELAALLAEHWEEAEEALEHARRGLREAHRLFVEMGATGHAEPLARELGL